MAEPIQYCKVISLQLDKFILQKIKTDCNILETFQRLQRVGIKLAPSLCYAPEHMFSGVELYMQLAP